MTEIPIKIMLQLILERSEKLLKDIYDHQGDWWFENDLKAIIDSLRLCVQTLEKVEK